MIIFFVLNTNLDSMTFELVETEVSCVSRHDSYEATYQVSLPQFTDDTEHRTDTELGV